MPRDTPTSRAISRFECFPVECRWRISAQSSNLITFHDGWWLYFQLAFLALFSVGVNRLDRVRHLIYVAAFVPAAGESGALLGGTGALVNDAVRRNTDGTTSIPAEHAHEFLYADCTDSLSEWASGLLVPQQPGHGRGVPQRIAWTNVESTYVKCEQDQALSPALQEQMALRCTHVVRLPSSHSPFISQPLRLGAVIMKTCPDLAALATD